MPLSAAAASRGRDRSLAKAVARVQAEPPNETLPKIKALDQVRKRDRERPRSGAPKEERDERRRIYSAERGESRSGKGSSSSAARDHSEPIESGRPRATGLVR